ncbi:Uncharacterised protein [Acidipropionibacterium jensenii]|uniref:Tetratricopeptide repeat protein n=2 Tax=Acidipropionibacterium jensenii TaxID=1749 RepID=A0A448NYW6_9ACTN|nr:Uncharacterised protein [Acidipropionibacterium jensenii]
MGHPDARVVRGQLYCDWPDTIRQMKRDHQYGEALSLLAECQDAAISDPVGGIAPWYFEQAAIIYRSEKCYDEEIACLGKYLEACPPDRRNHHYDALNTRRLKAQQLKSESRRRQQAERRTAK